MKKPPDIIVQLIHIHGPLKGRIQEFTGPEISIGRHPSCDLSFPPDTNIVSRQHARIIRDGNRFKLNDQSSNGTFVNGKAVQETYLKDGDVLTFAQGGPKVSFLTSIVEGRAAEETPQEPPAPSVETPAAGGPEARPPAPGPAPPHTAEKTKVPLIIQFGPTLQSFDELPVQIGRHPDCRFVIEHTGILDRHAEVFFEDGHYWIKDLTGKNSVSVNQTPAGLKCPLRPDDFIAFSPEGPFFRFLGSGRLAEADPPEPVDESSAAEAYEEPPPRTHPETKKAGDIKSFFKKYLGR